MKLGILFSSGKDSFYAMYKVKEDVVCLISVIPENKESYMFHTPNIELVDVQAKALGIPIVKVNSKGEKEKELKDLKKAILLAKKKYKIKGIVTGAVASTYQTSRIQKICNELKLQCFNPLWQMDQVKLLKEIINNKFKVVITGVGGYPLGKEWLGKEINYKTLKELEKIKDILNPAGEGGELETFVVNSPMHKYKIKIIKRKIEYKNYSGVFKINKVELIEK